MHGPIYFIHDFGSALSAAEVDSAIRRSLGPQVVITAMPVTRFSTLEAGFCLRQLASRASHDTVFYVNVDPRTNRPADWVEVNQGAQLVYFQLDGGPRGLAPNAGYTLSFVRESLSALYPVRYAASGSPFRSRDDFPPVLRALCNNALLRRHGTGDLPAADLGRPLHSGCKVVPDLPPGIRVAHVDGSGNIKLTARASALGGHDFGTCVGVTIKRGDTGAPVTPEPLHVVYRPGDFDGTEPGQLSLVRGSSGPRDDPYLELFALCRGPRDQGAKQLIGDVVVEDIVELTPIR